MFVFVHQIMTIKGNVLVFYFFLTSQNEIYIITNKSPPQHKVCQKGLQEFTKDDNQRNHIKEFKWSSINFDRCF
jgi:hypothetical protein